MKKIKLNKKFYKHKDVKNLLGNDMEFNRITPNNLTEGKPPTSNGFFKIYNENFYDLSKQTHNYLITKSKDYIDEVINPRQTDINNLEKEIERIQIEIDSVDREHPYFSNGSIIMHKDYNKSFVSGFGGISSEGKIEGPKYYMHSGKKRLISDNYTLYTNIKNRLGMKDLKDSDIILFLWPGGLNAISDGPPISTVQDLFISSYNVNMYKPS